MDSLGEEGFFQCAVWMMMVDSCLWEEKLFECSVEWRQLGCEIDQGMTGRGPEQSRFLGNFIVHRSCVPVLGT